MNKRSWIVVGLVLAAAPLSILLGEGGDHVAAAEKWVARYTGPGNGYDVGEAIALDSAGNVYITGCSTGKDSDTDYATLKYDKSGKQVWVKRYNGPGNGPDYPWALVIDSSDNIYIAGESRGSDKHSDFATIKYNKDGKQMWVRRYDGPGKGDDGATAIALDPSGNVLITGWSLVSGKNYAYCTIKYNPTGKELWAKRYTEKGKANSSAYAIAVDGTGNTFVSGESYNTDAQSVVATVKYSPDGKQLWANRSKGSGKTRQWGRALVVDGSGNAYVTAAGQGDKTDFLTTKFSASGKIIWEKKYDGPSHGDDRPWAVALDGSGNVFVVGYVNMMENKGDFTTIKYNPTGKLLWANIYQGPGNSEDCARAIVIDRAGNAIVAGYSVGKGTAADITTIKYSPGGKRLWVKRFDGPTHYTDVAYGIAMDSSGNVFLTGCSDGIGTGYDYITIKY